MKLRPGLAATVVVALAMFFAASAQAAFPSAYGGAVTCTAEPAAGNIRVCSGQTKTWDGTRIDVNVFLPPETGGPEGPYPLIGDFHGWGGAKLGLKEEKRLGLVPIEEEDPRIRSWAEHGYAVFSMSDRGWGDSCGKYDPQVGTAECSHGYNHLMDDRYEVRDAQFLISELADEGIAEPRRIGATGVSYGGGLSIALAALRNREMLPEGRLVPWRSPGGLDMELAAAVPQWPWTELSYSLVPNGRNLDYVTESSYKGPAGNFPIGVEKFSYVEGLNAVGTAISNYSTTDPEASIPTWLLRLKAGEPYTDAEIDAIVGQLSTYHSSFGIEHSVEPSPLLIQSGWNDDLFPVDEALRFYQRTRAQYPADPISLYEADYGHARSQNKPADVAAFNQRLEAWFAHYLKGEGAAPSSSVEALTTTCSAPSGGPYRADDWSGLAPGEIRFRSDPPQTVAPRAEEQAPTTTSKEFDPITGPGACASVPAADEAGAVDYSLGAAPEGGFTLMGSPTVIAKLDVPSPNSELVARLLDVSPEGTESLVARTLYRPDGGTQEVVFQLHPQGYRFAAGHVAKLELLPSEALYGRPSNQQTPITVSDLELRLPVTEQPGSLGGLVQTPAPKVVPAGYTLAAEYQTKASGGAGAGTSNPKSTPAPIRFGAGGFAGGFKVTRKAVFVPLRCVGGGACSGRVLVRVKRPGAKGLLSLARGTYSVPEAARAKVRLPLTGAGRKLVKTLLSGRQGSSMLRGVVRLNDSGRPMLTLKRPVHLPRRH